MKSRSLKTFTTAIEGYQYEFYLNDIVHEKLDEKFKKGLMISHGVVSENTVKCTFLYELDEEKDIDLLRAQRLTWSFKKLKGVIVKKATK